MILNQKNILAVASDFDGTIIQEGQTVPPSEFYEVVEKLLAKNIPFIAASGRQYGNLHGLLGPFCDQVSYIAENGCLVVYQGNVIHKSTIERSIAMELISAAQTYKECEIMVSGEKTSYLVSENTDFINLIKYQIKHNVTLLHSYQDIPEEILKISTYWGKSIPKEPENWFHQNFDSKLQVVDSGNGWLDFNALGSGKGQALQVLSQYMEIPTQNIVAFGDSENDISMIKEAGIGYAVTSSKPHVKAIADFVCDRIEPVLLEALSQESLDF